MKISVIIISYNQKDYLVEAIESVLNQTLQPYEIIIADDCSSDGSQSLIKEYVKQYPNLIRAFYHKQNRGIPENRNSALERVEGHLITFLDGDDRFLPRKLELELETFKKHPEASIIFSNIYYVDELGRRIGLWAERNSPPTGYVFKEAFSRSWPHNSLYRNELIDFHVLKKVGFYDEDLYIYDVWDLKIRLTHKFKVAYCATPLAEYRQHAKGISGKSNAGSHLEGMKRIYEKNRHLLEELPENDRREVEQKLCGIFYRLEAKIAFENGQRMVAFKKYLTYLKKNSTNLSDYKFLLKIFLPESTHKLIRTA